MLLYDGLCGFCNETVQFALRHDRRGTMRFAPLQGDTARAILSRYPELDGIDSLVLVERDPETGEERVSTRSTGVLRVLHHLGGPWRVIATIYRYLIPRPVRDWGYDRFAQLRYRLFGRYETCPLPSAEQRARFLD